MLPVTIPAWLFITFVIVNLFISISLFFKGHHFTVSRTELESGSRKDLTMFLEMRGSAVYEDECTELLRECALDDFDNG
jgi:hypothetical protein